MALLRHLHNLEILRNCS
uniref:Uncharacterized protein n=1 Tax=Rhizophora mucronata TaxID=61149 RepID=A0A2P2NZ63_RHIMU